MVNGSNRGNGEIGEFKFLPSPFIFMPISQKNKKLLCEFHNYICEGPCKKKYPLEELEIHRIKRDWQGGNYKDHRNLKVLCAKCHDLFTYGGQTGWN